MQRKETGSYYTDPGLVDELIQTSLKPIVEERVDHEASPEVQEQQLLEITVCDPACGSGAFLIAANNFLGQQLAEIRSDSQYPDERTVRQARRSVVQHCIYGVDLNPMAAELAKVSLWINSAVDDKPLSFLNHRIKQGNSLIGTTPELMNQGLPVDAYETSKGREWHKGNEIRKRVRLENKELDNNDRQVRLDRRWDQADDDYISLAEQLDRLEEGEIEDVYEKERIYQELRESESFQREKIAYDVWTSAFYWPLDNSADEYPSPNTIERIRRDPPEPSDKSLSELEGLQQLRERAVKIATNQSFFHWPLEFPEVFSKNDGFDCLLGNPPWEVIKMEDEKFFSVVAPEIANAGTQSKRKGMIEELENSNPELYKRYQRERTSIDHTVQFIRNSGRYPLTGSGEINTYPLFSELTLTNINQSGRAGIIVPTGIATDSPNQDFFREIVEGRQISSLHSFVNRKGIFPDIHRSYTFCLLTLTGESAGETALDVSFYLDEIGQLHNPELSFELSHEDIELLNPNTKTLTTFRNREAAELTLKIYRETGVFKNLDQDNGNPWNIELKRMFHAGDDSGLFKRRDELQKEGWKLDGNIFVNEKTDRQYIPVYESKLFHQYDHRFATYENIPAEDTDSENPEQLPANAKTLSKQIIPRYWIPKSDYETKNGDSWHIGVRDITRATDGRTAITSLLPGVASINTLYHIVGADAEDALLIVSAFNSFALDYTARQKVNGTHLSQYITRQLPVPYDNFFDLKIDGEQIAKRVRELALMLSYTNNELSEFAKETNIEGGPFEYSTPDSGTREDIRYQLEALMCHVYNLSAGDFEELFSSFSQIQRRDKEKYGYYRTRDEIKKRFEELAHRITDTSEDEQ